VLDGDPAATPQTAGWINMSLGKEVGLGPDRIVLNSDSSPLPKKGAKPPSQFSAHFCCGQMAECMNMPLGIEVGLSLGFKKFAKKNRNFANHRCLTCFDVLECNVNL